MWEAPHQTVMIKEAFFAICKIIDYAILHKNEEMGCIDFSCHSAQSKPLYHNAYQE